MLTISVKVPGVTREDDQFYRLTVPVAWARRHDNFALISCGLTVGEDGFTARMFAAARRRYACRAITREAYGHSGCQSACTLRGAPECRW